MSTIGFIPSKKNPGHLKVAVWEGMRPDSLRDDDPSYLGSYFSCRREARLNAKAIQAHLDSGATPTASFRDFLRNARPSRSLFESISENQLVLIKGVCYELPSEKRRKRIRHATAYRPKKTYVGDEDANDGESGPVPEFEPDPPTSNPGETLPPDPLTESPADLPPPEAGK